MGITLDLLKAEHVGARALRNNLFEFLKEDGPLVVTDRGKPVRVILNYEKILELLDMLDELSDPETVEAVREGRKAIAKGVKGIPVSRLFNEVRKSRKKK